MWQLKNQGHVDQNVVQVYTGESSFGNNSYIKFGSWDEDSTTEELYTMKTFDFTTWSLRAKSFEFSSKEFLPNEDRIVDFSPHSKYIYLPDADW